MTARDFVTLLKEHPDHGIELLLPDGSTVPAHFHITEVGYLSKSFIDCGGEVHRNESCLLQVWVADDTDHRVNTDKLLQIFGRADKVLPNMELPVELEYEAPVLTQLPLIGHEAADGILRLSLGVKHTDCLAKDLCVPDFSMPAIPGSCQPGSGCC
ncbi:MAG: DUF6428 family protein [Verrucomicrobiota bacterium]